VRLTLIAREAARTCVERPCTEQFTKSGDGPYCSLELLALLTFNYGTGVFPIDRICHRARTEVLCATLITRAVPGPETLRAFRRLERIAVSSCLERFFDLAADACHPEVTNAVGAAQWTEALQLPRPPVRGAGGLDRLVRERINQATWTDRMLLDS
jgi:hypothetical protein